MRARGLAWLGLVVALASPLGAQTHPGGRWWTLETAHFRVHVRPSQRELGARAAGEAEAAFAALAAELPPPHARIDLVVTDHLDEANGSASVYPTPVIVINAVPPAGEIELGTYDRWLRLVITHELAHIFDLDLARGWWRVARAVFGRAPGLFPNDYAPTWRIEGLAVYYESRLTGGGRLRGSFHGDVVAAAAAERHGLAIDGAGALSPRWPGGIRPYVFGSRFLSWVAAERGDSVMPRLVRAGAGQLVPYLSLNGTLGRAAGISLTAAWHVWEDSLRARAARPAPAEGGRCASLDQRRPSGRLCGLRLAIQPRVAPDGARLLLAVYDGRDAVKLGVFDPGTGELRRVARLNSDARVAWNGDGGAVVSQLDFTDPYTVRGDLWRVGLDGRAVRLTRGARLGDLDVGPRGEIVAVRAVPGGNELARVSPDGRVTTLVAAAPGIEWAGPRFAPDGRSLAVVRVKDGWRDIVLLSPDGDVTSEVTADPVMDRDPAFSPDGRWLFWSRDVDNTPQVVGLALDTTGARRVFTDAPFGAYAPAVTRDSLYYLSYQSEGYRLEALARSDTGAQPLGATTMERPDVPPPPATSIAREHAYHAWPSVLPHFWSPVGEQQVGGVGFAGVFTSGGDALGRHRYAADLSFGTGGASGTWRGGLAYVYAGFTPALFDLSYSRDQLRYYLVANPSVLLCCIADESAAAGITVRHRRWRTAYAARLGAEYDRTGTAEYRGVVVSAAAAHTVEPALSISTQDGWRLSATLRRKERIGTALGHTEHYVRLAAFTSFAGGGFARHVFAARAAVGVITGNDNVGYGLGGISGGSVELLPGVTFGTGSRNFPVRGYAPAAKVARQVGSLSLELRSPLALVGRGYGLWPAMLDRVSLVFFTDLAGTRAPSNCPQFSAGGGGASACLAGFGSAGAELVTDLGVAYDFPVRLRFGAARRFSGGGAAYVAVGAGF